MAVGCDNAVEMGLTNIAFLRTDILALETFFNQAEVSEIWVTFPDPRIRLRDIKRRLTYSRFLEIYKNILKSNSFLFLKTDNTPFFEFSLESLSAFGVQNLIYTDDLYESEYKDMALPIKTRFEEIFTGKGFKIKFLRCILVQ